MKSPATAQAAATMAVLNDAAKQAASKRAEAREAARRKAIVRIDDAVMEYTPSGTRQEVAAEQMGAAMLAAAMACRRFLGDHNALQDRDKRRRFRKEALRQFESLLKAETGA